MTNLIRKNNLPIGGMDDDYQEWDQNRFFFFSRPTTKPDCPWTMLDEDGRYRAVDVGGMSMDTSNMRIMRKAQVENVKVLYRGEALARYDLRLEELIDLDENGDGGNIKYTNGEITMGAAHDRIQFNSHTSSVDHVLSNIILYSSAKYMERRYLLSTGTLTSTASTVDVILYNVTSGIARHLPRSSVKDVMPSVISISREAVTNVLAVIDGEWDGDTLELRVLVTEGEELDYVLTTLRHDVYLNMHGTTATLLPAIAHIAPDLEDQRTPLVAFYNQAFSAEDNTTAVMDGDVYSILEGSNNRTIASEWVHIGQSVEMEVGQKLHTWSTDLDVPSGLIPISNTINKPVNPYSIYHKVGDNYTLTNVNSTRYTTTDTTITPNATSEDLYLLHHNVTAAETYAVTKDSPMIMLDNPLRTNVEVKLGNKWLIPDIEFAVNNDVILITSMSLGNAELVAEVVTYGDALHNDSAHVCHLGVHRNNTFEEIGGAMPNDIIITANRRWSYSEIVGRGVMMNEPFMYLSELNHHPEIKEAFADVTVYSPYHNKMIQWLDSHAEAEIDDMLPITLNSVPELTTYKELFNRLSFNHNSINLHPSVVPSGGVINVSPNTIKAFRCLIGNYLGL